MASTQVFILLFICSCLLILSTAHGDEKRTNKKYPEKARYYPGALEQVAGYYDPRIRKQAAAYYDPQIREQVAGYYHPRATYRLQEANGARMWHCYSIIGCQGTSITVNGVNGCCYSKKWPSFRRGNDEKCYTCRELTVFESTSKMAVQRKKQPSQTLDEMMKLFGGLSEADLWNNRLRDVTLALAGQIPKVGAVIKALIGHFWPPKKEDIWSLIKDQVQELVDSRILQHELEEREAEIRGLHATMVYYVEAKDIEKGILMGAMVAKSLELFEKFTRSSNRKQLIPLTITHSYLHLGILKERLLSGTRIFGADNSEVWQWNLETTVEEYERFFAVVYLEWKEWRDSKIEAKWGTTKKPTTIPPFFLWHCHGDVIDHFTGASASYADSLCNIPKRFQNVCERIKQKMVGEADSEMMEVYSRTFYLENFIPGKECNPPKVDPNLRVDIVAVGPYSVATADVSHPPSDAKIGSSKPVADKPGIITSILVREYNSIDAMQLTYRDHVGPLVGNSRGGKPHTIQLRDRYIVEVHMGFANGLLAQVQFIFSDGTKTPILGNRSKWRLKVVKNVGLGKDWQLACIHMVSGSGPSGTRGPAELVLDFMPFSGPENCSN